MIQFIEKVMALSPAILLVLLLASLWTTSDDGSCPAWLHKVTVAALAVFIVLMSIGMVMTL